MFLHKPNLQGPKGLQHEYLRQRKDPNVRDIPSFNNITALTHCVPNDSCVDSAKEKMLFFFYLVNMETITAQNESKRKDFLYDSVNA
jgi:hypothetical protein